MAAGEVVTPLAVIGCVWGLIQFIGLKAWPAVLVLAAGFYLAPSAAPQIHEFVSRIPALSGH